jgi:hypothetical protein
MRRVKLRDICHARSGDKGDTVNIGLICYDLANYPWLARHVTTEIVLAHFGKWVRGPAERYELPRVGALNFLIHGALDGGVTKALMIDGHGKGYSTILLELEIEADGLPVGGVSA